MRPGLTAILQCPRCFGPLKDVSTSSDGPTEIEQGVLHCGACTKNWPVRNGVPRLLPEGVAQEVESTGERFGYEWTTYSELSSFYEDQFLAWVSPLCREDFQGKRVLDAGCGKGRHMVLAHEFGASEVVGIDVGVAVEAARANTRDLKGAEVVQANILQPPLANAFDIIYCVGVLHHLPDPGAGFRALAGLLAPGGRIHVWVYGFEGNGWIRLFCDPVRKHVLRRLPPVVIQPLAWFVALPLWPLTLVYRAARRVAPWLHRRLFYAPYLTFLGGLPFRSLRWIVFDQMVAPTTHYIREEQLRTWLQRAGLTDIRVESLRGMSWRGSGRAPAEAEAAR